MALELDFCGIANPCFLIFTWKKIPYEKLLKPAKKPSDNPTICDFFPGWTFPPKATSALGAPTKGLQETSQNFW